MYRKPNYFPPDSPPPRNNHPSLYYPTTYHKHYLPNYSHSFFCSFSFLSGFPGTKRPMTK